MPARILVIDDEPDVVMIIKTALQAEGYDVASATNGPDGLEEAFETRPDLIILDVMMPIMDGFEVLKMLRQDPKTENTPVIILTARTQDHDVFMGYHYGADMYLTKPFNPRELMTIVERF